MLLPSGHWKLDAANSIYRMRLLRMTMTTGKFVLESLSKSDSRNTLTGLNSPYLMKLSEQKNLPKFT